MTIYRECCGKGALLSFPLAEAAEFSMPVQGK